MSHYHDLLLRVVSDARFRPYHAQGVNLVKMTPAIKRSFRCFISKIVYDLDRHRPWVLKDPRMMLFTQHWLQQARTLTQLLRLMSMTNSFMLVRSLM